MKRYRVIRLSLHLRNGLVRKTKDRGAKTGDLLATKKFGLLHVQNSFGWKMQSAMGRIVPSRLI